jgi:mannose-6-phosphate isomerase-like protein (cupin superfamily)
MAQNVTSYKDVQAKLTQPWVHVALGQVDDYCVYLCRFEGTYRFHQHSRDEMYLVLEGEIVIEFRGGPILVLRQGDSLVVKAGELHRSAATESALVLMFKARDLFAE